MMTTAIILAGGLGTRLRSIISDVPKPMALINDRPFLAHQLDYWIAQGVKRFILSVGYKHEIIVSFFGTTYKGAVIDYVIEQEPLGTGGALLLAAQKVQDNSSFLLLNGDTYFGVNLERLMYFAEENKADWCLSLFNTANKNSRYMGIDISSDGRINSLNSDNNKDNVLVNGGVYWVRKSALASYTIPTTQVSLETIILPEALKSQQRLFGLECSEKFIDIGIPEDYHRSQLLLA